MNNLKSNPIYSKMFAAVEVKTTEQLQDSFVLLNAMPSSKEKSISMAVIFEVLEVRDSIMANNLIDSLN